MPHPRPRSVFAGALLGCVLLSFAARAQEESRETPPTPPPPTAANATESNELDGADVGRRRPTRGTTRVELGGAPVTVAFGLPAADGREYREMEALEPGEVVRFFDAAAIKLSTGVGLRAGELAIPAENVAPGYPGVYSLWLRRVASGWELVFNEKPDVWGTQHDPSADRGAVPLRHTADGEPVSPFAAELRGAGMLGELELRWGPHRWTVELAATPTG